MTFGRSGRSSIQYILTAKKSSHELENHKKSVLILSLMPHPVLFYTSNIKFYLNSKPVGISLKKNSIQLIIVSFLCFHTTVWKMTSNFSQVMCSNWNGNCFIKKRVKSDWQPNFFGSCISLQHRGKSLGEIDFLCITFQTKKREENHVIFQTHIL